jgi:hypothetical protein
MRTRPAIVAVALLCVSIPTAWAQIADPIGQETKPSKPNPAMPDAASKSPIQVVKDEAARYVSDSVALLDAPLHWTPKQWEIFGALGVAVGGLMVFDRRLATESQERRSPATDSLSRATTRFGSGDAWVFSGTLVASGLLFKDSNVTSMGRDAIEASVFSGLITSLSKLTVGRERPTRSNNQTDFDLGSGNQSFPSGHATQAFTVASVIAARSEGWLIPTVAYTAATLVAYDRVNDRAHFPSDVAAGAAIGVAVGRYIVHRHQAEEQPLGAVQVAVVPIGRGMAVHLEF